LTQLADQPRRPVHIAFDQDDNQAGQKASHQPSLRFQGVGVRAHIVRLPHGHDPNSYFVGGATAADFNECLVSPRSLRAYAYDLLHFACWFQSRPRPWRKSPNPLYWTMSAIN
jgi:hypothetical protein